MRKIKILFLSHTANLCGAERCLCDLLARLNKDKYESLVILPSGGTLRNKLGQLGIRHIIYPIPRWITFPGEFGLRHFLRLSLGLPKRLAFLSKIIKRENIDLVYTNTVTTIDGAIVAKIKRIPHIWHVHESLENIHLNSYVPVFLVRHILNSLSGKILFVSDYVAQYFNFANGQYNGKASVVHNGIDLEEFDLLSCARKRADLYTELKLKKETKIIALVGRYVRSKGQHDFIQAARIVARYFPDVAFILVGPGGGRYLAELKESAEKLGLNGKMHFLSFQEDVIPLYDLIDIFVLASWNESCSRVTIEAMAAGKSIVATRCGGPQELLVDSESGFLVPVKSPEKLAEKIITLLSNRKLAQRMGGMAQKRARELFGIDRYISKVEEAIEQAVELCN